MVVSSMSQECGQVQVQVQPRESNLHRNLKPKFPQDLLIATPLPIPPSHSHSAWEEQAGEEVSDTVSKGMTPLLFLFCDAPAR